MRIGVPNIEELVAAGPTLVTREKSDRRYKIYGRGEHVEVFKTAGVRTNDDDPEGPPEVIWELAYTASIASCTCPGFANRTQCRHIDFIKQALARKAQA